MIKKISVILTLYKTPIDKLNNLNSYKKFSLIVFDQEGSLEEKKKIKKILKRNFRYFFSKRNIFCQYLLIYESDDHDSNFFESTLSRKIKHPGLITPPFLRKILAAKPRENFGLFSHF